MSKLLRSWQPLFYEIQKKNYLMMDIGNYFSSSKKRHHSDNSKEDTDPKKAKEATSSSSYSAHDIFEEGLGSSNYRSILFDCLKRLESKVNEIFENTNTLKENQIKGEKQVTDLAETVNFISEKFHEFEADRKLKGEIIKSLRGQVFVLHDDFKKVFKNKKLLKRKGVSITESLRKECMAKLNEARETYGFRNVWTCDGKIFFKDLKNPSSKPLVYYD